MKQKNILKLLYTFSKEKLFIFLNYYFENSTYCYVEINNNNLIFKTNNTSGSIPIKQNNLNNAFIIMRHLIGNNILQIKGIPDNVLHECFLILTPSVLYKAKFNIKKILNNWKGKSYIGDTAVIVYKIFGEK